jgi:hypothetical protein
MRKIRDTGSFAIPRFFFHLRRGKELIADEDGDDLPDVETAYLTAFSSARELWAAALVRRDDPAAYTFEVAGENGEFLFTLPLTEVLEAAQKGRKRVDLVEVRAVMEHNRALRSSLLRQIENTRDSIERTYELLRTLREREGH